MKKVELAIIGGGPAGLAAAVEAYDNGVKDILIIERDNELGGILNQCIHTGFGLHVFGEELTGPEYALNYKKMVEDREIEYLLKTMVLNISKNRVITVVGKETGLMNIECGAIVLAMGCRERSRGAINIAGSRPAGIFTAGTAQRFINREGYMVGKKVVILGSGDIGLIMARRMTLEGAEVKMVCELEPYSNGLNRNIVQCLNDFDIPLRLSHTITSVQGKERLEGVTIAQVDENKAIIEGTEEEIECDTLLLSVGLIPENELSREAGLNIDRVTSGPIVNESMETSIEGVFACGNVVHVHDLVDFVTKESIRAGHAAAHYIKDKMTMPKGAVIKTKGENGVRYVVPQQIRKDGIKEEIPLFFRVGKVYDNVQLEVRSGDQILFSTKKRKLIPGEMENVMIKPEQFAKAKEEIVVALV